MLSGKFSFFKLNEEIMLSLSPSSFLNMLIKLSFFDLLKRTSEFLSIKCNSAASFMFCSYSVTNFCLFDS